MSFPMPWLNWSFLQSSLHQTICTKELSIVFHFSSSSSSLFTQVLLISLVAALSLSLPPLSGFSWNCWIVLLSLLSCLAFKNLSSKAIPCGKWISLEAAWTYHAVKECILFSFKCIMVCCFDHSSELSFYISLQVVLEGKQVGIGAQRL